MLDLDQKKDTAIVVAGGSGSRMGTQIPKQYLKLCGREVICWCLDAFENSEIIDEVIIAAAPDYVNFCRENIVTAYGFRKVKQVVCGGAQRYDSVYAGLQASRDADYVYIHDAARPYLRQDLIRLLAQEVRKYDAVTAVVPLRDTIKREDAAGFAGETLDRSLLRAVQTPQVFSGSLIRDAYAHMMHASHEDVTDDTMTVERFGGARVKFVPGSYLNQKITTREDLILMEAALKALHDPAQMRI